MAITAGEDRAFDPNQPFSRAEARAAGIGLKTLMSSRFHKIFYDCYVSSTVPLTTRLRAKAALGVSPLGTFISHATAARIWGGIVPDTPDVHVTVPGTAASRTGCLERPRYGGRTSPLQDGVDAAHHRSLNVLPAVLRNDPSYDQISPEALHRFLTLCTGCKPCRATRVRRFPTESRSPTTALSMVAAIYPA